jgi:hypothetical protein
MEEMIELARDSPKVKEILQKKLVLLSTADLITKADMLPSVLIELEGRRYAMDVGGRVMDKMEEEIECHESTIKALYKKDRKS